MISSADDKEVLSPAPCNQRAVKNLLQDIRRVLKKPVAFLKAVERIVVVQLSQAELYQHRFLPVLPGCRAELLGELVEVVEIRKSRQLVPVHAALHLILKALTQLFDLIRALRHVRVVQERELSSILHDLPVADGVKDVPAAVLHPHMVDDIVVRTLMARKPLSDLRDAGRIVRVDVPEHRLIEARHQVGALPSHELTQPVGDEKYVGSSVHILVDSERDLQHLEVLSPCTVKRIQFPVRIS